MEYKSFQSYLILQSSLIEEYPGEKQRYKDSSESMPLPCKKKRTKDLSRQMQKTRNFKAWQQLSQLSQIFSMTALSF